MARRVLIAFLLVLPFIPAGVLAQGEGTPGELPGVPGEMPGIPGEVTPTPGKMPGIPGKMPGTPGAMEGTPGAMPGTPGAGKSKPWSLSDLLWGIPRLRGTPYDLTEEQRSQALSAVEKVIATTELVANLEANVRKVLSREQWEFIQEQQAKGNLSVDPHTLPPAPPGQDPLVTYVVELLKKKAGVTQ